MKIVDCLTETISKTVKYGKQNAAGILIFTGTVGLISAGVVACKATPKATQILANTKTEDLYNEALVNEECMSNEEFKKEHAKLYLKAAKGLVLNYAPAVTIAIGSVVCIAKSYSINQKKIAALATAYSISDTAYKNYRDKVIQTLGKSKDEMIKAEIAQDAINDDPVSNHYIIETDTGTTLCYDTLSGRYFHCNIDTIRKAESVMNRRILTEEYILLNEFYQEIGLPICQVGDLVGWDIDNMIEISFSSGLSENTEPCLVIDYSVGPKYV